MLLAAGEAPRGSRDVLLSCVEQCRRAGIKENVPMLPKTLVGVIASATVALVCGSALAQNQGQSETYTPGYVPGGYSTMPYYGGYGGWGFNNGIGSTAAGSYLGGLASAIRAEGQYNLMSSAAAINLEEAAKRDIENRQRW